MSTRHLLNRISALVVSSVFALLAGCGSGSISSVTQHGASLTGSVHGGQQPVTGAQVQLYAVGTTGDGSAATPLLVLPVTTSDGTGLPNANANLSNDFNRMPAGSFVITGNYSCPSASAQVYLTALGGNPGLAAGTNNPALTMMSMLGACGDLTPSTLIQINELTTVASLAPLAPFMGGYTALGSSAADAPQLLNAIALVRSYTDVYAGTVPGPALEPGYYASTLEVTTLADILAGCVNSDGGTPCQQLFSLATPPGGTAPADTIGAALDILKFPANNTAAIFNLLSPSAPFQPTLTSAPASWSLPILPYAAVPVISPAAGSYTAAPTVTIADSTPGAVIRYTLDGSAPTAASPVYNGAFTLTGSTVVKAVAMASGYATSAAASAAYTLPAAGTPTRLAFLTQPVDSAVGFTVQGVRVGVVDAYGNLTPTSGVSLTIALGANSGAATLNGTRFATTSKDGSVTFTNLSVSAAGTGYTLVVSAAGYSPITSAAFTVYPYAITLTQPLQVVGVGRSTPGTVTLSTAAPAGGVVVSLSVADSGVVTVSPLSVTIPAGGTTASYTITGVAGNGTTNAQTLLTASAKSYGYNAQTLAEYAANAFVQFGTLPTVAPGGSAPLPLSLTTPATTAFTANILTANASIATVSPSTVTFNAGATTPTVTPTVSVYGYGGVALTTQPNYGLFGGETQTLATGTNSLLLTPSLSTSGNVAQDTLTLASPAPSGGLLVTLASDNTAIATLPASVTVAAGTTTATFRINGVSIGRTTVRAKYPGLADATSAVTVGGSMSVSNANSAVMAYVNGYLLLNGVPAANSGASITVTSSNPGVMLLSLDPAAVGTPSITITNPTSTTVTFYEQGQAVGQSTLTATSDVYGTASYTQMVYPSTFSLQTPDFSTVAAGANTTINVSLYVQTPTLLSACASLLGSYNFGCRLSPGVTASVPVLSSNPATGTITTSPVVFTPGTANLTTQFHPVGPGTSNIILGTLPPGFVAASGGITSITATVAQPTFTATSTSDTIGSGLYYSRTASLASPVSTAVPVTVTSSNPALLLVSSSAAAVGAASVTFPSVTSAIPAVYVQGQASGSATLTYSSPGYASLTVPVAIGKGSLLIPYPLSLSLTTVSAPTTLLVQAGVLSTSGGLNYLCTTQCFVNPGVDATVGVSAATPGVVSFSPSPINIPSGANSATLTVTPVATGMTNFNLGAVPAPFAAASTGNTNTATVTQATLTTSSATVGANMQTSATVTLNYAAGTAVDATVTSSNPGVAVVSLGSATPGTGSITLASFKSGSRTYYVQGVSPGSATLTISAPGYSTTTAAVTVQPTGFVFDYYTPATFTTTSFATPTTLTVDLVLLNPSTLAIQSYCTAPCMLNPGLSAMVGVVSSNPAVAAVNTPTLTFTSGNNTATTTLTPYDLGTTALSLTQPAGFSTPSNAGFTSGVVTVTGDLVTVPNLSIGAGTYTPTSASLAITPGRPTSITVSVADGSLARLSTDPAVLGTGTSLTFDNITCTSYYCSAGGPPMFYVQGLAAGYTRLTVSARGYRATTSTVAINKLGVTLPSQSTQYIYSYNGNPNMPTVTGTVSLLDPYSLAVISDCNITSPCNLNPGGTAPQATLALDDPSVASFGPSPAPDSVGFLRFPYIAQNPGISNYSVTAVPAGYSITSTPGRRAGIASTYIRNTTTNALFVTAHDVDTGVGMQVAGNVALSGTVIGYDTTPYVVTVADPTVATVSLASTTAGSATVSFASAAYIDNTLWVQGQKAGTTTVTITKPGYNPRTFTVTVRPAGFLFRGFDTTNKVLNGNFTFTVTPAILNDAGQWLANATLNPGTSATVPVVSSNTAAATVTTATVSFGSAASSATFQVHPVAAGTAAFTLGAPSGVYRQATTYQTVATTLY